MQSGTAEFLRECLISPILNKRKEFTPALLAFHSLKFMLLNEIASLSTFIQWCFLISFLKHEIIILVELRIIFKTSVISYISWSLTMSLYADHCALLVKYI